ncbi:SulP family inorganic anion transporter [Microbulbifer thermotolerans]|uniref:Sodium-independent anion transporter n=1 Tax=Microbulbifer thermotolerans TaxID=252514 RepID=A0A143HLZ6_MICTH|nr:sulfate permease [Microbulbifer thermotolerans]AMX02718.1 sodium-independent anion transporter [Microbulbifer thermotolerans]MCX2779571.1 sulfate permease [Microbulbifer thermotolerans]MCX2782536.1 sulfate permease [Microbulbifer thermotolerans]MCX2794549.1 sulfate permease [Microbulbifer thermotolerans]MCX2801376.1 sulfate permease [Microbulbifer thermotolerans]
MPARKLIPHWFKHYRREWLAGDATTALVATMMLVPQALAYAALAGLPPHIGLYAGLLPLVGYALFGTSSVLSVGPVAVLALMTAHALSPLAAPGSPEYIAGAVLLATLSGLILFAMGLLRLGVLSNLLSHPVISGFVSGAAALIIAGQIAPLLGINSEAEGDTALQLFLSTLKEVPNADRATTGLGLASVLTLVAARIWLTPALKLLGLSESRARLFARLAPMSVVLIAIALTTLFHWEEQMPVVGEIPRGLPKLEIPALDWQLIYKLLLPAVIIALLGFVESLSIAHAIALRRGERLNADAELRGLGAANLLSALSGGFPVTGSFARTAINDEGGAVSPMSSLIAAGLLALVLLFATAPFTELPLCVLAATIIVAATSLIDVRGFLNTWRYDRTDGVAMAGTFFGVLLFGVEAGIGLGIGFSFATLIWRTSRPHIAVVGRVPGTEHFRNVLRHTVETQPNILFLRIDESLFFSNISAVEERLLSELKRHPNIRELVLILSSVNRIDGTALERLQQVNRDLLARDIRLHLSEVKGPVLDRLGRSKFLEELSGRVFLSSYIAELALSRDQSKQ